jgi:hypothetical protein
MGRGGKMRDKCGAEGLCHFLSNLASWEQQTTSCYQVYALLQSRLGNYFVDKGMILWQKK